jgi:hypothetical protein
MLSVVRFKKLARTNLWKETNVGEDNTEPVKVSIVLLTG